MIYQLKVNFISSIPAVTAPQKTASSEEEHIKLLIEDLDSDVFNIRQKAAKELISKGQKLLDVIGTKNNSGRKDLEFFLRELLKAKQEGSAEVKRRVTFEIRNSLMETAMQKLENKYRASFNFSNLEIYIDKAIEKHQNQFLDDIFLLMDVEIFPESYGMHIKKQIAACHHTPVAYLIKLSSEEKSDAVKIGLANNFVTPLSILKILSTESNPEIRALVAKNPNCLEDVRIKLSTDKEIHVRTVAASQIIDTKTLERLCDDLAHEVRTEVARNSHATSQILERLCDDLAHEVRTEVARNSYATSQILEKLHKDKDNYVRRCVAIHRNTPKKVLEVLAKDDNDYVRAYVAENKAIAPEILELLAEDKFDDVRKSVARHQKTELKALEILLHDSNENVRSSVAQHPNASIKILKHLSGDESVLVRRALVKNENTPSEILLKLSQDERINRYNTFQSDEYMGFAVGLASHKNTPTVVLAKLSQNYFPVVRETVGQNPSTPIDVLKKLLKDDFETVRDIARKRLEKK
ncbi:MAG: HEAT repeat domain-containing protein [Candidatus Melainabacteria bacterium]|nr:HEAT repeat domain-containing protein [Candidatus Melainabacteria bacterium]